MTTGKPKEERRPRIGVDYHTWDGIFQGMRSHFLGLYREAIRQAPDFDFVFFLENTESLRAAHPEFAASNVTLVHMPRRHGAWRLAVQMPLLQRRHRLDMLHLHYRMPFIGAGDCAVTIHDILYETNPEFYKASYVKEAKILFRHAACKAAVLFTISEFSKNEIATRYAVPRERIHVTVNGVDERLFFAATGPDPRLEKWGLSHKGYLLTVGRLEPRKNHATLLQAYAQLPRNPLPLVIVGQRDFGYEHIFRQIQETGLEKRVRLLENVDDDSLPLIVRHARIFVFPSLSEGFGLPVVEAMASGVPVITSNTGALPEVAGEGAIYAPPRDATELARLVKQVLADDQGSENLAARGVRQAAKYTWRNSAAVMMEVYRRKIGGIV